MSLPRRTTGRSATLLLTIAAGMLSLPVLFPPEIHPWSLIGCGGLAAAALGIVALSPPAPGRRSASSLLILAPLAVAAILLAPARARALDEAAAFGILLLAGLLGARLAREARATDLISVTLIVLGTVASLQAILQYHFFYPQQLELLRADPRPEFDGLMVRFAAGRPAGPFILPAVLGTFLAMSLPPLLVLVPRARGCITRVAALVALLLQGYALFLTRSFGAILAVTVAMLLLLPLLSRPARRIAALAIVVVLLAGSGYSLYSRRAEIGHAPGSDPISLRLGNWQAAGRMIGDHPMFGVGPGSFGTSYTLYLRPGMNETRYAHNSYLQIVACWGLWALVPIGALLLGIVSALRRMLAGGDPRLPLAAGGAAFLVHNGIDFGVYLPGIAIPAALLLGLVLGQSSQEAAASAPLPVTGRLRIAGAFLAALLLLSHITPQARSRALLHAARDAARAGDLEHAAALAHDATEVRPAEPDAWAFLAEMTLVHWRDVPLRWVTGEGASLRAVQLDPESAIRHYTRALYHHAAGAGAAAYREQAIANRLFPRKDLYSLPAVPAPEDTP